MSSGKKQSEDDYEEDFEFEEIEDIEEDLDFGLNNQQTKKGGRQESRDGFEELDNMIDELDTINDKQKPGFSQNRPVRQSGDYALELDGEEELDIEEEPQEIYEEGFEQYEGEEGNEEEDDDQIMPEYIVSEDNIALTNQYIASTRYQQPSYDLEEFNNLDAFYFIFEE